MTILFDTSVLVAALVKAHPVHERAVSWLKRAKTGEVIMAISSHTLAELYAVLTTLPVSPRISPDMAWRLIHENIEKTATVISMDAADYTETILRLKERGFSGGIVYDALIFFAAVKSKAATLLTLNAADFVRLKQQEDIKIIEP
ncbi:MAG: PIN domain-containing protein [Nitrospirae bacterium]|nr:PIN domain-containing protein [Nitrospirota bacterium]